MPYKEEHFINRELSWLEFNKRVLEEAADPTQPLLERVKFLSIFSTNLDEFFEIRVAGIKQQIAFNSADSGPDGLTPTELFEKIQIRVHELLGELHTLWEKEIRPLLHNHNIVLHEIESLTSAQKKHLSEYFHQEVFPVLTPLAVDASHPFPQVPNKLSSLIFELKTEEDNGCADTLAIVQLPRVLPRLIPIKRNSKTGAHYVLLTDLVANFGSKLFPGCKIHGAYPFRVTRNSDLFIDEEEVDNLLRSIEISLRKRNRGNSVRLQVNQNTPKHLITFLLNNFELTESDLYLCPEPINMQHLNVIAFHPDFPQLRDRPFTPSHDLALPPRCDIFAAIRKQDILLHHPYESFDDVVSFIADAAQDPKVLAIKITLYRTSGDSPIVTALIDAAQKGKQVTAVVEIKARFDEENNIQWARRLEEAGVNVIYGVVGLKTHCKTLLIVRRDEDRLRRYAHLATGNYHPKTARIYTDLGLLTCRDEITEEVALMFNILTGVTKYPGFKHLMMAPFDLAERLLDLIRAETESAQAGFPARIVLKLNSLVDETIISALYDASSAGVRVELIVRGICCLRPGVPGISENIKVTSIVGRFLEHSRIFYFENRADPIVLLGSADLMPRNLYRRVEIVFPILSPDLKKHVIEDIIEVFLSDNVKARQLGPDGNYTRVKRGENEEMHAAQLTFREHSRKQLAQLSLPDPRSTREITPVRSV